MSAGRRTRAVTSAIAGALLGCAPVTAAVPEATRSQRSYDVECTSEPIRDVIANHIDEANACYRSPVMVMIGWQVQADGTVAGFKNGGLSAASSPKEAAAFQTCVMQRIARWPFPKHDGAPIDVGLVLSIGIPRAEAGDVAGRFQGSGVSMGAVDKEEIRRAIREHAPEIRACYEARLSSDRGLQGKVVVRWLIQPEGSVSEARVDEGSTTLRDAALHECMVSRIRSWTFPRPKRGGYAIIAYPWSFRTAEPGGAADADP